MMAACSQVMWEMQSYREHVWNIFLTLISSAQYVRTALERTSAEQEQKGISKDRKESAPFVGKPI